MAENKEQYQNFLTELTQTLLVVLGPNIVLDKAKKIRDLMLQEDGAVIKIGGDPKLVLKEVIATYSSLSAPVTMQIAGTLLNKYPEIKVPLKVTA